MVGSFNGFVRSNIEGGSGENGVGHRFEKRRVGGVVNLASLGADESARGIGVVATLAMRRPLRKEASVRYRLRA
jgi:hypothetical protein